MTLENKRRANTNDHLSESQTWCFYLNYDLDFYIIERFNFDSISIIIIMLCVLNVWIAIRKFDLDITIIEQLNHWTYNFNLLWIDVKKYDI